GHARFGWKLVAKVLPGMREHERVRLGAYLTTAFVHLERHELAHLPVTACPPDEGRALGLCRGAEARALFYATVEEVIVPGLSARGLDGRAAWDARDQRRVARHPRSP